MFVITIKEVSERYDLSQDTLRYYERVGMIPPVHRTASGIRDYQPDDLGWIELAKCMRGAGLPVEANTGRRTYHSGKIAAFDRTARIAVGAERKN